MDSSYLREDKKLISVSGLYKKIISRAPNNNNINSDMGATIATFLMKVAVVANTHKSQKIVKIENGRLGDLDG